LIPVQKFDSTVKVQRPKMIGSANNHYIVEKR